LLNKDHYTLSSKEQSIQLTSGFKKTAVALKLAKKNIPSAFQFDDGVLIQFKRTKPHHISLYCMTDSTDLKSKEVCDLRLFQNDLKSSESTVQNNAQT